MTQPAPPSRSARHGPSAPQTPGGGAAPSRHRCRIGRHRTAVPLATMRWQHTGAPGRGRVAAQGEGIMARCGAASTDAPGRALARLRVRVVAGLPGGAA